MKITLTDAGKRFNRDWIFRHISLEFSSGHSYAIIGPNGSGKSTLLQLIAGAIQPSEGKVEYQLQNAGNPGADQPMVPPELAYLQLSLTAPYLETVEEMTVTEFLEFHAIFKPFLSGCTVFQIIRLVGLEKAAQKQIRYFSSGMKQRVKLAQAIFSDTSVLLMDEPCTNLDDEGFALYQELIRQYAGGRLVVVSSNDAQEYGFCRNRVDIMDYK
jgi:ABC-type multidrug transport system ATPase subunit